MVYPNVSSVVHRWLSHDWMSFRGWKLAMVTMVHDRRLKLACQIIGGISSILVSWSIISSVCMQDFRGTWMSEVVAPKLEKYLFRHDPSGTLW